MIRAAATVILLRDAAQGLEVFLLRRHRGASFMASAYVFPGGALDPGEDARTAAARELLEEANVTIAADSLVPWAEWVTPSIEAKRFFATFFVGELPAGQVPRFDAKETVDQAWIAPRDGGARSKELALPPPQIRTLWELAQCGSVAEVLAAARARAAALHPIMPRLAPGATPMLLLPWDPEYETAGTGEGTPMEACPAWAIGPSRFVMEDRTWKHVVAPGSTNAG